MFHSGITRVGLKHINLLLSRTLADVNADGKMDRREFIIAMFLIKRKLQGYEVPPTLPMSLLRSSDSATSPPSTAAVPPYPAATAGMMIRPPAGQ